MRLVFILLFTVLGSFASLAQTTITGKISDGVNFLAGATVQLKNSTGPVVTEKMGRFKCSELRQAFMS
jgi:hypothetical protein